MLPLLFFAFHEAVRHVDREVVQVDSGQKVYYQDKHLLGIELVF